MNIRIRSIKITERFLCATLHRFGDEPCMARGIQLGPCDCEAELKGHIESGRGRRISIELNAREVVNGIPATLNKRKDAIKAVYPSRNCESCFGREAKFSETDDI